MTDRADKNKKVDYFFSANDLDEENLRASKNAPDTPHSVAANGSPQIKPQQVLGLQRVIGNRAVQRLLTKQSADEKKSRVVQPSFQSPALQMRQRLQSAPSSPHIIRRAVKTWAGDWDTTRYDAVKLSDLDPTVDAADDKEVGVDIELKFVPGEPVNATQIGAVQTIVSFNKGSISLPSGDAKTLTDRTIPVGEEGAGTRIDRLAPAGSDYGNPLYGTNESSGADTLDTASTMGNAQHGFRFKDKGGAVKQKDTILRDRPTRPARGENANQIFETTALAVGGEQEGTYYGSVQWGWESDAKGKFTKLPLTLKSNDVPTENFGAASELWNKSKTAKGNDTINLPIVSGKFTNYEKVWLVTNPSKYQSTRIDKLPKNTRVEVTEKGESEKFNQVTDDKYIWWKVTVTSGTAIGKVGWVMQHYLSDAETMEKKEPGWWESIWKTLFGGGS